MVARTAVLCLVLSLGGSAVLADTAADCSQGTNAELRIEACTELVQRRDQPPDERARAYKNRGSAYAEIGNQDQAIADFTDAIRLDAAYAIAFGGRGQAKLAKGDFDGAIADYTQAIRFKAKYPADFLSRGYAYLVKGDVDRAIADFSEAIKLAPHSVIALNNRGLARKQKGELDLAIEDYTAAIEFNPSYALAYNNRGYVYEAKGQKQKAIDDFRQALTLDPSLVGARDGLKRIGGDPALTVETEALVRDGKALAQKNCAWCHAIEGQGASPNKNAPAWRNLQRGYPILALREPLSRGIARPHDVMPQFILSDHETDMIIAYINSLAPEK
jgi:tetratricopeptide (TPR) repeat protein